MKHYPQGQIYRGELEFISECVLYYPDSETGGDFFGFWSKDGNPVIQYVLGPGEKTTRTATSFFQDIGYLKECGSFLNRQYGLEHIGAWHSHHTLGLFRPSSGDVQTMRNALRNQYPTRFLISICNIERSNSISIGSFLFSKEDPNDYTPCSIQIVSGSSPIRDSLRNPNWDTRPFIETNQKVRFDTFSSSREKPASFKLRDLETIETLQTKEAPDKPLFSETSIWSRSEGHQYLKRIFDKLNNSDDFSPVEIKQLADKRPAISFNYYGVQCEIRFPLDFPTNVPDAVIHNNVERVYGQSWHPFKKQKNQIDRSDAIQRIIDSLNLVDDGRRIMIRDQ